MIVDPNTGQPISANTVGGQFGLNALDAANADIPLAQQLLASMPSALHTTAWNMRRTSNTITSGARRGATHARGVRQTLSPFSFNRLGSVSNIEPPSGSRTYTPFNFMASNANRALTAVGRRRPEFLARTFGAPSAEGTWFSPGTMGRLSAMGKVYGVSEARLAGMAGNITSSFGTLNPAQSAVAARRMYMSGSVMGLDSLIINPTGRNELGQMLGMSMRGSISQQLAGYVHGSAMGARGVSAVEARSLSAADSFFAKGVTKYEQHLAAKGVAGFAAKNARFLGVASRAAGPIGTALLVKDLALMSGKILSSAAKTAIDAGASIKGSIDKPIMGMGFRDNTVAMTSRQRGVMAIQNSRLNMRSALGNEAAGIHAVWG